MKRLAVALIIITCATPALAQDEGLGGDAPKTKETAKKAEESLALPIHPLEGAKEGDWTAFVWTMKAGQREEKSLDDWKIAKIADGKIEVQQRSSTKTETLDAKEVPALEQFLGMTSTKVTDVKVENDQKAMGGRTFATKKITFKSDDGRMVVNVSLWISKDVKGSGIVAMHIEGDLQKGTKFTADLEVAGFGSKDKTEFGKSVEDVQKDVNEANKKKKDEAEKAPPKKD